ncbi:MAG: aldo/keto reductase [Paracoccaceae bacterium]|nr:aldo/keto reductase [Paracoccaceae bacterium]
MITRRHILGGLAGMALPIRLRAGEDGHRPIPSTGEAIPAIGLGSWITFNVGNDPVLRGRSAAVIAAFFEEGGGMIDSSPMYGSSQEVIGDGLARLGYPAALFSADKVWTRAVDGDAQIEATRRNWGVEQFDLLQVHNLVAWRSHLPRLSEMKAAGLVRYVGITTSHGRRHRDFEAVMKAHPLDFVQLTLNAVDREIETRLLPLARDRGMAVIVNRPFRRGALPERLRNAPLPGWAAEIGVTSWAQALIKFILAHPAVTVAIPATTRVDHVRENKAAALGPMPDAALRERIARDVDRAI